jgi:hypothetical protein
VVQLFRPMQRTSWGSSHASRTCATARMATWMATGCAPLPTGRSGQILTAAFIRNGLALPFDGTKES